MKPYYEHDGIVIYHGDCREVLPTLNDIDTVITDPPYGIGMNAFDDNFDTGIDGFCASPGKFAAVFHSPRKVIEFVTRSNTWDFERMLWMHKNADIAAPWRGWCMNSEAIAIFSRGNNLAWPIPETYRSDTYSVGPWERAGHANGKPLSVVSDLVKRLTDFEWTILDPFMGSGTTLRAAKDLGRKAIGIEIEERYCEIAANRLAQGVFAFSESPGAAKGG